MSCSARAASASAWSAVTVMKACSASLSAAMRSRQARVISTGDSSRRAMAAAASRILPGIMVCFRGRGVRRARMAELGVGVAQRCRGTRDHLEQGLQPREPARVRIRDRALEPGGDVTAHQKVSVPRTLIGIMWTLWVTGVVKRLMVYLN